MAGLGGRGGEGEEPQKVTWSLTQPSRRPRETLLWTPLTPINPPPVGWRTNVHKEMGEDGSLKTWVGLCYWLKGLRKGCSRSRPPDIHYSDQTSGRLQCRTNPEAKNAGLSLLKNALFTPEPPDSFCSVDSGHTLQEGPEASVNGPWGYIWCSSKTASPNQRSQQGVLGGSRDPFLSTEIR
ncbi:uncharacterized protein RBU33_018589 isoform 1-T1 [Hipposideros larvatus]